jgi:DNA-binding NtrC family response regulator
MEAQEKLLWIASGPPRFGDESCMLSATYAVERLSPEEALEVLSLREFSAVILSFPAPGWAPCDLLEAVRRLAPSVPVLIRDPHASVFDAIRLVRLGAHQFLPEGDQAIAQIEQAIEERRTRDLASLAEQVGREEWERMLIGDSREMRRVGHIIRLVGGRRSTVLITGETGTGKELAARALHMASARRRAPWVAVNCSALPEHLLEAELFGHVRGAFTGAVQNRVGRFEEAQGGTIFLDEIGDLPLDLQAKLLRVLQEREFQRLGSSETIRLDVRVVAATNCDLTERIEQGKFREDLYYRLNVVPIQMPPLRERREDIRPIASFLVAKICKWEGVAPKQLSVEAAERLSSYSWPGNVRQLENFISMAVALSGDRTVLVPADFTLPAAPRPVAVPLEAPVISVPDQGMDYERTLALIERSILEQALRKTGGNKKAAAEMLCLKRTTLSAKVRSLESVA